MLSENSKCRHFCFDVVALAPVLGEEDLPFFYLRLFFFAFPPPPCCNEGLDIVTGAAAVAGTAVCDDGEALSCAGGALLCILAIRERFSRSNLFRSCA